MKFLKRSFYFLLILLFSAWLYCNSLIGVEEQVKTYYSELKNELIKKNYPTNIFVISGRRWKWDNYLLQKYGGAASKSKHKSGQAIDIIVLDINGDGKSDADDVDIVYKILDKKIVQSNGGIGTYKKESGFFNRQMIHFDCRGNKARWNR
ncbi:MAG: hypothetical protein AAFZ15_16895 [Bacteroidota bacterium]